jgi:methylenetetrahydrofolate reductase (NADPH)
MLPHPCDAYTSAEISLPGRPEPGRVADRIATLAAHVDLVGLTDNHAGKPRMSPLAAVALAREQGVSTVVHVSCRDRNRLALQSQVVGAVALGSAGILCLYGDPVDGLGRVGDMTTTRLLAAAREWAAPRPVALGCVVDPFARDPDKELALLARKRQAGAEFVQSQMVFDVPRLEQFLERAAEDGLVEHMHVYASVAVLRDQQMADFANSSLPGFRLPEAAYEQIIAGGGIDLAIELAERLASVPGVNALHVMPLGDEASAGRVAAAYRSARGVPVRRTRIS